MIPFPLLNKILIFAINSTAILLSVLVYRNDPKGKVNRIFMLMTVFMLYWVNFAYLARLVGYREPDLGFIFLKVAWFVTPLFFTFLYFLIIHILEIESKYQFLNKIILLFGLLASLMTGFTDLVVAGIKFVELNLRIIYGKAMLPYLAIILFLTLSTLYNFVKEYKKYSADKKLKLNYFLIGISLFYLANAIFNIILPVLFDIVRFYWIGDYSTIFLLGLTTYAIVKRELFGIKVFLVQILVMAMGLILLILPFLMPTTGLRVLIAVAFLLFCIFGYYLVKAAYEESRRREEAESFAYRERILRKAAEDILGEKEILAEKFQAIAIRSTAFKNQAEEFAKREMKLREKAEKLAQDFQKLNDVRNQMFLTGHHHSRTPLAHIKNFASLLLEEAYGPISKEQKWALQTIFNKVQESIDLANLYLTVAELESGKKVISKEKTKLQKIVRDQIKKLSYEAKLKNIKIAAKIEDDLPEVKVDPEKIGVVYYAIVENALKYAPKKGGKISIGLKNTEKNTILFYCQDNGIGIKREEIQNLGQVPYQRTESARAVHGTGKGLALYLSNLIVKGHQGKFWAESEGEGKGTIFYVEMPIK